MDSYFGFLRMLFFLGFVYLLGQLLLLASGVVKPLNRGLWFLALVFGQSHRVLFCVISDRTCLSVKKRVSKKKLFIFKLKVFGHYFMPVGGSRSDSKVLQALFKVTKLSYESRSNLKIWPSRIQKLKGF